MFKVARFHDKILAVLLLYTVVGMGGDECISCGVGGV